MRAHYLFSIPLLVLGLSIATGCPASAADQQCSLKMLASVDTESDPAGGMYVPGNFGGTRKYLLVDTGGVFHMLKPAVVKELGLTTRENQEFAMVDVLGQRTTKVARAPAFSIGNTTPVPVDFAVTATDALLGDDTMAGLFFPGVYYRTLDVDLDFVGHKFSLLSQDHCPGNVIYWPNSGVAVVPFQFEGLHIVFPVKVEGYELMAELDSGASETTMFTRIARRLGVDVDKSGDVAETGQLGDNANVRTYSHRFRSLAIEGITVSNPMITLIPDMNTRMQVGPSMGTRIGTPRGSAEAEMLIGMSILRHLHVYIAAGEKNLYITAGAAAATAAPATAAPAPPAQPGQ
jgi:predicted aspartyl protease